VLVDRPVHVAPDTADLHVGLVHEPAATHCMPAGSGRVDHERGEVLHPSVQAHVIHLDPALREQLLEVAVGQPEPQIPAHAQQDHLGWEPVTGEHRQPQLDRTAGSATLHPNSLAAQHPINQRNRAVQLPSGAG
jgi:hypothetical protein